MVQVERIRVDKASGNDACMHQRALDQLLRAHVHCPSTLHRAWHVASHGLHHPRRCPATAQVLPNKCLAPSRDGCRAPSSRWVAPGRRRARHAHGAPQARTSAHASKDLHARTAMSQGTRCLAYHLHASLQQTRMARGRQCTCWVVMLPCANHVHNRRAHSGRRRRAWCA